LIDHNNLEEFTDPHVYDLLDSSDTGVAFYTALASETDGPVLEIACGTRSAEPQWDHYDPRRSIQAASRCLLCRLPAHAQ